MTDILNYVCRGLNESERHIAQLAKRTKNHNAILLYLGFGCIVLAKVAAENARDIRELKSKIKTMEASNQEGA